MTTIHQNRNRMDPKILGMVAIGIIIVAIVALAFNAFVSVSSSITPPVIEESPPGETDIASNDDAIQARLRKIADERYPFIESSMIRRAPNGLSLDDWCSDLIIAGEELGPMGGTLLNVKTKYGFYAGPILFIDKDGNEIELVADVAIFEDAGGVLVGEYLRDCTIVALKEPNQRFREEFIYW